VHIVDRVNIAGSVCVCVFVCLCSLRSISLDILHSTTAANNCELCTKGEVYVLF